MAHIGDTDGTNHGPNRIGLGGGVNMNLFLFGGGAFTPADLGDGVVMWLNAKRSTITEGDDTLPEDGERIRRITNLKGIASHATQGTDTNAPVYHTSQGPGGAACWSHIGANSHLSGTLTGSNSDNWTLWYLARMVDATNRGWFDMSDTTATNRCCNLIGASTIIWRNSNGTTSQDATGTINPGVWSVYCGVTTGSSGREIRKQNIRMGFNVTSQTTNAPANYRLGMLFGNIFPATGSVAEVVLLNRVATQEEHNKMHAYFEREWGSGSLDDPS